MEQKAAIFGPVSLYNVLTLPFDAAKSIKQFLLVGILTLVCMTGQRMQDVHRLYSNGWKKLPPKASQPRALLFESLVVGKNLDKKRKVSAHDLKNYVPCLCFTFCLDEMRKAAFAIEMQGNMECPCIPNIGCPYGILLNYLAHVPDPKGIERDNEISRNIKSPTGKTLLPLMFFRAVDTSRDESTKKFTLGPIGINKMKECFTYCNNRLPRELQISDPTGHTGRVSFMNNAKRGGASEMSICASTHHAVGSRSSIGYIDGNDQTIGTEGAFAIGRLMMTELKDSDTSTKIGGFEIPTSGETFILEGKDTAPLVVMGEAGNILVTEDIQVKVVGNEVVVEASSARANVSGGSNNNARATYVFNFSGSGAVNVNNC